MNNIAKINSYKIQKLLDFENKIYPAIRILRVDGRY